MESKQTKSVRTLHSYWGDYSPVLRAAFHDEKVTFSRKTNNEMYNNLPNQGNQMDFQNASKAKYDFFDKLPDDFTRQQAIEIGKSVNLSDRTIDGILKNALGIKLEKIKAGHYKKIP